MGVGGSCRRPQSECRHWLMHVLKPDMQGASQTANRVVQANNFFTVTTPSVAELMEKLEKPRKTRLSQAYNILDLCR